MGTENNNVYVSAPGYAVGIYEPMAVMNRVNPSQEIVPWLAEEFEFSPDYMTLTAKARDGVLWSDGTPFTADDIGFTLQMLLDHPELDANRMPMTEVSVDGDTVTVNFSESMFTRREQILHKPIVAEHIWGEVDDLTTWTNLNPVGTGPYTLKNYTSQSAELERRDDYWNGEVAVETLYFVVYNDNNAVATGLANGDVDCSQVFIPNVKSVYLDKDPEHNEYLVQSQMNIDALYLNNETKPFNDKTFRQALNMVVDRVMHSEIAREGMVPPLESVTGMPTPAADSFIAPSLIGKQYNVDVEGARDLLEKAGYTWEGDQLVDPDGDDVEFSLTAVQGWGDYVTGSSLIADQAKKLGANARVVTMDYDTWDEDVRNGDFQSTFYWTKSGQTPYNIYNPMMDGRYLKPIGEAAQFNFGRYDNPRATELLDIYATSTDEDERTKAISEVQEIMVEDVPAIAVATRPSIGAYNTRNFVGWPSLDDPYASGDLIEVTGILTLNSLESVHND